jgi:hypothetical protein
MNSYLKKLMQDYPYKYGHKADHTDYEVLLQSNSYSNDDLFYLFLGIKPSKKQDCEENLKYVVDLNYLFIVLYDLEFEFRHYEVNKLGEIDQLEEMIDELSVFPSNYENVFEKIVKNKNKLHGMGNSTLNCINRFYDFVNDMSKCYVSARIKICEEKKDVKTDFIDHLIQPYMQDDKINKMIQSYKKKNLVPNDLFEESPAFATDLKLYIMAHSKKTKKAQISKKGWINILKEIKEKYSKETEYILDSLLKCDSCEESANERKSPSISSTKDKMICYLMDYYIGKEGEVMKEKHKGEKQEPSPSCSLILHKEMDMFFSGKISSPTDKSIRGALKDAQAHHPQNDEIFVSLRKTDE